MKFVARVLFTRELCRADLLNEVCGWLTWHHLGQEHIRTGGGEEERVTLIGACGAGRIFETCEVYHGVLVLFCRVILSYSYIGHCPITFSA